MADEYVSHNQGGISLGLEHRFRLARLDGNFSVIDMPGRQIVLGLNGEWVLFDYHTKRIVEHIPKQDSRYWSEYAAMKRLYEVNRASQKPTREVLADMDASE